MGIFDRPTLAEGENPASMEEAALTEKEAKAADRGWKKDIEKAGMYRSYLEGKAAAEGPSTAQIQEKQLQNQLLIGAQGQGLGAEMAGAMLGAEGSTGQVQKGMQQIGTGVLEQSALAALSDEQLEEQVMRAMAQQSLQNVANSYQAQAQNTATYATAGAPMASSAISAGTGYKADIYESDLKYG